MGTGSAVNGKRRFFSISAQDVASAASTAFSAPPGGFSNLRTDARLLPFMLRAAAGRFAYAAVFT